MYGQNVHLEELNLLIFRQRSLFLVITLFMVLKGGGCSSFLVNSVPLSQALKHLNSIQVINFGDCLVRPSGAVAIAESISEGLPILKVTFRENSALIIVDHSALWNFIFLSFLILIVCQELNLSFGEITEEAALAVANAMKDKSQLEKLDLNGTVWPHLYLVILDVPSAADWCREEKLICWLYFCQVTVWERKVAKLSWTLWRV